MKTLLMSFPTDGCCFLLCSLSDKAVKDYSVYKPHLLFFSLVNCLPHMLFAVGFHLSFVVFTAAQKSKCCSL